jgi:hypothetical protein
LEQTGRANVESEQFIALKVEAFSILFYGLAIAGVDAVWREL